MYHQILANMRQYIAAAVYCGWTRLWGMGGLEKNDHEFPFLGRICGITPTFLYFLGQENIDVLIQSNHVRIDRQKTLKTA